MTDDEYIRYELTKGAPSEPGDVPQLKVRGPKGESRWVNIPADRYAAVVHAASTPPSTQYCHCCTDNQCACEGIALRRGEPAVVIGDLEI